MCLAIPAQIVEVFPGGDLASADVSGVHRSVNIGLLNEERIAAGDWVLIHVGFAISKVDEQEAKASLEFLQGLGQAFADEIDALKNSVEGSA
ncbi:MAG TPA: HypC/HybG/HupF family hydrogenase formation chaperone [Bryobacteraceae bacterium]|nr:HypC/HybG/HupF family hydrogenase formation chaperone [Bryobacteraceae bacterium]